jgi:cytochrome c553
VTRECSVGAAAIVVLSVVAAHTISRDETAGANPDGLRPPARLSEAGLYAPASLDVIDPRNRPFSPQYPLWSDGAVKRRWVYLPPNVAINVGEDDEWEFPVGTRFWKEFGFNGKKVETRLLWRASAERWIFASYMWNDEQSEAVLASEQGEPGVFAVQPNRRHSIPSVADCMACHGEKRPGPLGFNALQLSTDRDPNAIHAEPLENGMITVKTLVDEQRLLPAPSDLVSNPPRIRTASPRTRSALGYLATNCGSCHNGSGEIAALGPTIKRGDLMTDADAVAAELVGQLTKWQVPGLPEGASMLVKPDLIEKSAILVRMRSRQPSSQMPPLGTVVRDDKAIDFLRHWMANDLTDVR